MLRILATTSAHARSINGLAAADLGGTTVICSASYDGNVRLWRLEPGPLLCPLGTVSDDSAGAGAVFSVAASTQADGLVVCAGSHSREIRAWRCAIEAGQLILRKEFTSTAHTGWVRALAVNVDSAPSSTLYSVGCNRILGWSLADASTQFPSARSADSETAVFETDSAADIAASRSHDILCLAHSHQMLGSGSVDGAIRTWSTGDLAPGAALPEQLARWQGHADRVAALAWRRHTLLSAGYDGLVRSWRRPRIGDDSSAETAWELMAEQQVATGEGTTGRALSLAVSPSGQILCGTSAGELLALSSDELDIQSRVVLPDAAGMQRVTAIAAIPTRGEPCRGEQGIAAAASQAEASTEHKHGSLFVAAGSLGQLHVVEA